MTMIDCPECQGTGTEEQETFSDEGFYDITFIDCTNCKGHGQITPLKEEKDPDVGA